MMNYKEFKNYIVENIREYLPHSHKKRKLCIQKRFLVNQTRDLFHFWDPEKEKQVMKVFYFDELYDRYLQNENPLDILYYIVRELMLSEPRADELSLIDYMDKVQFIVFRLINTHENKELLEKVPHREFHDLSVVYYVQLELSHHENGSLCIDHQFAYRMGLSEEDLYMYAYKNTRELNPPKFQKLTEVVESLKDQEGPDNEQLSQEVAVPSYVISNVAGEYGAATVLYDETLKKIADELNSNFYLLPCSVHEWITMPVECSTTKELADLVWNVNQNILNLEDRLSNEVYLYDRELHSVIKVTDTGRKSLRNVWD